MRLVNIIAASLLFFSFWQTAAAENIQSERFHVVDNSIVVDSHTGLMWALQDNGKDIDWYGAKKFCTDFSAGGYTDWRLPDIEELATLYTGGESNKDGYFIAGPFKITDCCMWSSFDNMGGALAFSFKSGGKTPMYLTDKYQLRALPVRGTIKMDYASKNL
jgi:hypothetical protein